MGLYSVDLAGRIVQANARMAEILGYGHGGDLAGEALTARWADAAEWERRAARLLQDDIVHDDAVLWRTRAGAFTWVESDLRLVRDAAGRTLYIAGCLREATERKQRQAALEAASAHLEGAVREGAAELAETRAALQSEIGVRRQVLEELEDCDRAWTALAAVVTRVSPSADLKQTLEGVLTQILGWTGVRGGAIGLLDGTGPRLANVVHQGLEPGEVERVATLKLDQGPVGAAIRSNQAGLIPPLTGDPAKPVLPDPDLPLSAACPISADGTIQGVLLLVGAPPRPFDARDGRWLTTWGYQIGILVDHVRMGRDAAHLAALRQMDRLRSQLIANVAHELRTPLGLVKVFSSMLISKDMEFDRENRLEFLNAINGETDRLQQVIDNLLDLSQLQAQRVRLDLARVNLQHLAAEVLQAEQFQSTGHRFVCQFPETPLIAVIDRQRMVQVLRNLVGNAVKYSPTGSTIRIRGKADKGCVLLQVSDEGVGIPPEETDRIFERFYRVDNSATRAVVGLGLGLAITRDLVEAHGGRIEVESTVNAGSTFTIRLPGNDAAPEFEARPVDGASERLWDGQGQISDAGGG